VVESRDDERDTITATQIDERIEIENLHQCMLKPSSKIVDSRNDDAASTTSSINSKSSISSLLSRKSISKVKNVVGKIVNNNKQRVVEDGSKKPPLIPKKPPLLTRSTAAKVSSTKQQQKKKTKKKTAVKSTPNSTSSPKDISQYKGKIVGLSLPSHIPSDYNTRNKPIDCSVDATEFLDNIIRNQKKEGIDDNHWNKYDKKLDVMNVVLDVHLVPSSTTDNNSKSSGNNSISKEETVKIHMTRNPNEDISSTLSRLQLSIQKKLVVGGKKKKSKKSKGANQGTGEDTVVLLRKIKNEKEEKVQTHVSTVELAKSLSYESTNDEEVSSEVGGGCGISNCIHPFYDVLVPICDPWCVTDDSMKSTSSSHVDSDEISRVSKSQVQSKLVINSDILEETKESSDSIMEGYESIEYDSVTINEMLQLASNMNLDQYALSVPITNNNNTKVSSTSRIPLVLESNPPTITSVSTFGSFNDTHIFVNTPLVITVKSIYTTGVQITWFANDTQVCQDSICYTPTNEDVGKVISVVIIPYRTNDHDGKGCEEGYQFKRCVEILPTLPIMSNLRQEFITNRPMEATIKKFSDNHELNENSQEEEAETSIRIVTYNILADQNASRDIDNEVQMYGHCKNEHIIKWRRHPLIVHELLSYNLDVISLQEVDTDVFNELLKPTFEAFGYEGYYSQKGVDADSSIREGCAIFWSLSKFESVRPVDMKTHSFREMISQFSCNERLHKSQWNSLNAVSDLLDKHEHLKSVLHEKLGHVLQTVVLTQRSNQEKVVIGNTHLFYHPLASHIRCMKMLMACRQLQIEHWENEHCPIIFCGDLNSHPNSGVMKLMLDRQLCKNNGKTWKHLCAYQWSEGAIEEGGGMHHDVEAIDLEFPSSFPTFVSAYKDMPEFTHYIEMFVCTLDYILVTNNFELDKSGATPKREDIEKYIAMPNECMPSDHVSLVADLKWK